MYLVITVAKGIGLPMVPSLFSFLIPPTQKNEEWKKWCVCVCVCVRARVHVCCGGKEPRGLVSCISHLQSMQDDNPGIF